MCREMANFPRARQGTGADISRLTTFQVQAYSPAVGAFSKKLDDGDKVRGWWVRGWWPIKVARGLAWNSAALIGPGCLFALACAVPQVILHNDILESLVKRFGEGQMPYPLVFEVTNQQLARVSHIRYMPAEIAPRICLRLCCVYALF